MTAVRLISQDKLLDQRYLVDIVIEQSASNYEITSGMYNPINKTASLINIKKSSYEFSSLSMKVQDRKSLKNILWNRMVTHHLGKMAFVTSMWLIGIIDLILYLVFRQPSLLHWFNDILLIFGGVVLMGTIILMNEE